ncbi:hypothetical protein SALBM217S_07738 [Streptomyces griseoloalbus]
MDPTSYAPRLGGLIPALEIILDAVDAAMRDTGIGMRVLVAANRVKHPLDARTLARLAVGARPGRHRVRAVQRRAARDGP